MSAPGMAAPQAAVANWRVAAGSGLAAFDALAPEWLQFWRSLGEAATPFGHPQWIRAHIAAFEDPRRVLLLTARQGGRLGAVLPLIRERAWFCGLPVRRLRAAAGVYSVRFDLCALPGEEGRAAAAAIGDFLFRRGGWDVIELRDIPAGGTAELLIAKTAAFGCPIGAWESLQSPYVDLTGPWESGVAASLRKDIRRTRKRLHEAFPREREVGIDRVIWHGEPGLAEALEEFYELEAAGWKGRAGSAVACRPAARRFYDGACQALAAEGCLVLHRLKLGERLVAMSCGVQHHGCLFVLKWAYDEQYAKFGAGQILIEEMIRECTGAGLSGFDFTGPDDEYKTRWTALRLPHFWRYAFADRPYGRLLRVLKFEWTPRLKMRLGRKRAEVKQEG